jgi:hypothetical protein
MRATQNWMDSSRRIGHAVIWALILGFIATWIYQYDDCKATSTFESPQLMCLVSSLLSAYFSWLLAAIAAFLKIVTGFL